MEASGVTTRLVVPVVLYKQDIGRSITSQIYHVYTFITGGLSSFKTFA